MRLYWGSIALQLAFQIAWYGNVPYSALKLYPYPYESTKDAVQKLIRAGYVGIVKAPHVKSLYITPQGRDAVDEVRMKHGRDAMEKTPIVYHPPKADRVGRINEALILFQKADLGDGYYTSRDVKRDLEKDSRGGDQLKYSRFVGMRKKEDGCSVVYHFGRKNVQLNRNGEKNARQIAKFFHSKVDRLILGDNMDTLLSVLRYSQWVNAKTEKQRRHIRQLHFHVDLGSRVDGDICFLPMSRDSMLILNMMQQAGWEQWVQGLQGYFAQDGISVWMTLDCCVKPLLENFMHPGRIRRDSVLIVCYDWQEEFIKEFYSGIADRKQIWVQTVETEAVADAFLKKTENFICEDAPYRLYT